MFLALGSPPVKWREELASFNEKIAGTQRELTRARKIAGTPDRLSITADRALIDRIDKIIETDLAIEQDQLFRLRSAERSSDRPEATKRLEDRQVFLKSGSVRLEE